MIQQDWQIYLLIIFRYTLSFREFPESVGTGDIRIW